MSQVNENAALDAGDASLVARGNDSADAEVARILAAIAEQRDALLRATANRNEYLENERQLLARADEDAGAAARHTAQADEFVTLLGGANDDSLLKQIVGHRDQAARLLERAAAYRQAAGLARSKANEQPKEAATAAREALRLVEYELPLHAHRRAIEALEAEKEVFALKVARVLESAQALEAANLQLFGVSARLEDPRLRLARTLSVWLRLLIGEPFSAQVLTRWPLNSPPLTAPLAELPRRDNR